MTDCPLHNDPSPPDRVLEAVLGTYTPDGVKVWFEAWRNASPTRRAKMEQSALLMWS